MHNLDVVKYCKITMSLQHCHVNHNLVSFIYFNRQIFIFASVAHCLFLEHVNTRNEKGLNFTGMEDLVII